MTNVEQEARELESRLTNREMYLLSSLLRIKVIERSRKRVATRLRLAGSIV